MITPDQKKICIKLYTEGDHTIQDIISQTGLRYATDVYRILDEAGIPRKNRKGTRQMTISIGRKEENIISKYNEKNPSGLIEKALEEYDANRRLLTSQRETYLLSLCRLYHGEAENPIHKDEDAFKHYMWRNECKIIEISKHPEMISTHELEDPRNWTLFFRNHIRAYIELWVGSGDKKEYARWLDRYFNYKK